MALPSGIANLGFWFDAATIAQSNGSAVSSWTDSSGSGLTVTQATGGSQPTYQTNVINGRPTVRFAGAQFLSNASSMATGSGEFTLFVVARATTLTNAWAVFNGNTNGAAVGIDATATKRELLLRGQADVIGSAYTVSTWEIWTGTRVSTTSTLYVNGTQDATSSAGYSNASGGLILGAFEGGTGSFLIGDIAEVIGYSRGLTAYERAVVHSYLAEKYALTVSDFTQAGTPADIAPAAPLPLRAPSALIITPGAPAAPVTLTPAPDVAVLALPPVALARPVLLAMQDVTPLQPSSNPATPLVVPVGRAAPVAAPVALSGRSTADPFTGAPTVPVASSAPTPRSLPAPVVLLRAPGVADAPNSSGTIMVPGRTVAQAAPSPIVTRSTADPVAAPDTPTVPVLSRPAVGPALAAPAPWLAVSRDVTPLQASSNPAAPLVASAGVVAPVPTRTAVARPTADPVTDTPTVPSVAPVGRAAPLAAPAPWLALSRDVTPLQASSNPAAPLVASAGILGPQSAPAARLARSTADPAPTDTPTVPTVVRLASQPVTSAPPAILAAASGAAVVPSPWAALVVPAPGSPKVAAIASATRLTETLPIVPPRQTVATQGGYPGRPALAAVVRARYGAPPVPNVAGKLTGSTSTTPVTGTTATAALTGITSGTILTGGTT